MDERKEFIEKILKGRWTMIEACRLSDISRKTGYKWWDRFCDEGFEGLQDHSRAPHCHRNETDEAIVQAIVAARKRFPRWGGKKIVAWVSRREPALELPSARTADAILKREGLVRSRRFRRRVDAYDQPFVECRAPNALWCADFKGGFYTKDKRVCNPLTITDAHSRYVLRCEALGLMGEPQVRPIFEAAFCEFGLPAAIRTDNGPPFATLAPAGLSKLALWWIKMGIVPERIDPGKPTQNGRHERFHSTLKAETTKPPCRNRSAQQRCFDRFLRHFNEERPHEALGQVPPATVYMPSHRPYPVKLREPDYPDLAEVRRVRSRGAIKWQGCEIFISETLAGEPVGLIEQDDGRWTISFGPVLLGTINGKAQQFTRCPTRKPKRRRQTQQKDRGADAHV